MSWFNRMRQDIERLSAIVAEQQRQIEEGGKRIAELKKVIAWANNSLFGSHSFFLSMNGDPEDEHHLDRAIENIKELSNKRWRELTALQSAASLDLGPDWRKEAEKLAEALEPFAKAAWTYEPDEGDSGDQLWGNDRITIGDLRRARATLADFTSAKGGGDES